MREVGLLLRTLTISFSLLFLRMAVVVLAGPRDFPSIKQSTRSSTDCNKYQLLTHSLHPYTLCAIAKLRGRREAVKLIASRILPFYQDERNGSWDS